MGKSTLLNTQLRARSAKDDAEKEDGVGTPSSSLSISPLPLPMLPLVRETNDGGQYPDIEEFTQLSEEENAIMHKCGNFFYKVEESKLPELESEEKDLLIMALAKTLVGEEERCKKYLFRLFELQTDLQVAAGKVALVLPSPLHGLGLQRRLSSFSSDSSQLPRSGPL